MVCRQDVYAKRRVCGVLTMKMDITSRGFTVSHWLTTLGMVGGLLVYVIAFAQDQTRIETTQTAIQSSQKAEERRNKEWRQDVRGRQSEFNDTLQIIQQNQIEMIRLQRQK
jgi:hypothetical protein